MIVEMVKPIRCRYKCKYYGNEDGDENINKLPEEVKLDLIKKNKLREVKPIIKKPEKKEVKNGTNK